MEPGLAYCRSRIVGPFWRVLTIWSSRTMMWMESLVDESSLSC
jgi:hypothetical protein